MIELNKQEVCVGERSIVAFSQAYCEGDIIVPDSKPDMAKILQATANVIVSNKHCASDRITVEGRCDINVLYVSEHGTVCSINTIQTFSHVLDAKGVTDGMDAEIEADLQNVDYNMINSRKMSIKMLIAIDVNATAPVNANICTGVNNECNAELLKKVVRPYNKVYRGYEQITIKDCLELPVGQPDIDTILKSEMTLALGEVKPICDKIIVNGTGHLSLLYVDCADQTAIQFVEYEVPFSEVVEAPGTQEGMTVNVKIKCEQLYIDACCDSDGDNRRINMECLIGVCCKVFCETEMEVVEDAYCTKCRMKVEPETAIIDRLVACNKMQVTLKDVVTLPTDICQVCRIFAKPNISETAVENDKVRVEGIMEVDILYMSTESGNPINSFKHMHKFCQYVECDGIDDSMICDVNVCVEHINYNISMSNEVEFRIVATLDTRIIAKTAVNYISEVTEEEMQVAPKKNKCCVRVYFVQSGDRVWDIAKNYQTTVDRIISDNGLAGENDIFVGKQLIIS